MKIETLIDEALSLPVDLRVRLADLVLKSLNSHEPSLEDEWRELAKQRMANLRAGKTTAAPVAEVFERLMKGERVYAMAMQPE